MTRILFLGYVVPTEEAEHLSGASVAGNRMQLEMLEALATNSDVLVDILSVLPVATFPRERKLFHHLAVRRVSRNLAATYPGFVTIPVLKQFTQICGMLRHSSRLAKKMRYDHVLCFNMFPHVGLPAWWLKLRHGIDLVCLLADPPVPVAPTSNYVLTSARRGYNWVTKRLLRKVDRVIALSSLAAQEFVPDAPSMILDGAMNTSALHRFAPMPTKASDARRVVFTGALFHYNGIVEIIEAMSLVRDPRVELHIYGAGPLEDFVRKASTASPRVTFHGKVDSSLIPEIQRSAFLLVNPRQIDHVVSGLSFPSKLLEYMASGTPVLTTRLTSITQDYNDLLFFAEVGDSTDLAARIDEVSELPPTERDTRASQARRFVLEKRTWDAAARRIVSFLRGAS